MKEQLKTAIITTSVAIMASGAFAQEKQQPANITGQDDPRPAELPPPPPGKKHKHFLANEGQLKMLTTISGKVITFNVNDRYAYNSFNMQTATGQVTVRFPEHLAQQLMAVLKKDTQVTIKGFNGPEPDNTDVFHLVSASAGGTQIIDTPPAPPAIPAQAESKTYAGNVAEFKKDPRGTVNGLILDSKIVIDLPPHATGQLLPLLKAGDKVEVLGVKNTPAAGVVLAAGAPVIVHPKTITLAGQTYLLR